MEKFYPLIVQDIHRETPNAVSIAFRVPDNHHTDFQFEAGQYLTLRTHINDEEVRRSYSLCVSPLDGELRIAVKHLPGGLFSTFVKDDLKVGDKIDVMAPEGRFCHDFQEGEKNDYVAFAAGSGITPVMSLIKTAVQIEKDSHFTLFYGNRGSVDIIFLDQLAALKDEYPDQLSIHHILSREESEFSILSGRIDKDKINILTDHFIADISSLAKVFVCGPDTMMDAVEEIMIARGLPKDRLCIERFGSSISAEDRAAFAAKAKEAVGTQMEITYEGRKVQVPFSIEAGNVLDAIRAAGLPAPFSCKGGVCATCRAQITKGEVEMAVQYGLSDDEVARGQILTCQAVPITDHVAISYDI